jgi:hypothetical protein
MGRPRVHGSTSERPSRAVSLRLGADDHDALQARAEKAGLSVSDFVRDQLLVTRRKSAGERRELRTYTAALLAVARGLNAAGEKLNSKRVAKVVDLDVYASLLAELVSMDDALSELVARAD